MHPYTSLYNLALQVFPERKIWSYTKEIRLWARRAEIHTLRCISLSQTPSSYRGLLPSPLWTRSYVLWTQGRWITFTRTVKSCLVSAGLPRLPGYSQSMSSPWKLYFLWNHMADWMKVWRFSAVATMLENLESASHYDFSGSDGLQHGLSQGQDSIMRHLGPG